MKSNNTQVNPSLNVEAPTDNITIEKLQTATLFLTTKYAQTKNIKFAQAAYHNLCMLNDHNEANSELKYLCQSLMMEWRLIACKKSSSPSLFN